MGIVFSKPTTGSVAWFFIRAATVSAIAWAISFAVSDYVVKANTDDLTIAIQSLQSSIEQTNSNTVETLNLMNTSLQEAMDRLDTSIRDNTEASEGLKEQMTVFRERLATQSERLASLQTDVRNVQDSVQQSGIDIRAAFNAEYPISQKLAVSDWDEVITQYNLEGPTPILILPPEG